jgi:hypothetical protein
MAVFDDQRRRRIRLSNLTAKKTIPFVFSVKWRRMRKFDGRCSIEGFTWRNRLLCVNGWRRDVLYHLHPLPSPLREVNITNNTAKQKHEFTFTSSLFESSSNPSSAEQSRGSSVDLTSSWQSLPTLSTSSPPLPTVGPSRHSLQPEQPLPESPFPSVTLQPPSGSIPFSLRPLQPNEPPPPYPSRPVLPTVPLPRSGSLSPFLYSPGRTKLILPLIQRIVRRKN